MIDGSSGCGHTGAHVDCNRATSMIPTSLSLVSDCVVGTAAGKTCKVAFLFFSSRCQLFYCIFLVGHINPTVPKSRQTIDTLFANGDFHHSFYLHFSNYFVPVFLSVKS